MGISLHAVSRMPAVIIQACFGREPKPVIFDQEMQQLFFCLYVMSSVS